MGNLLSLEKWSFFHKFLQSPRQVGSIVPSSAFLTRRMMRAVDWSRIDAVAELGAGTGVFTKAIQDAVRPGTRVFVFEKDDAMRRRLVARYPSFACLPDACQLPAAVRSAGLETVDCVISGLPFANFTPALRERLLEGIETSLRPGGVLVAFQYSLQMKPLLIKRFASVRITYTPLNLPPAFVYVCTKAQH